MTDRAPDELDIEELFGEMESRSQPVRSLVDGTIEPGEFVAGESP